MLNNICMVIIVMVLVTWEETLWDSECHIINKSTTKAQN